MPKGFRERSAPYRAVVKNRRAMRARGMSRYEVRGLERDKALVRALAKRLAADDAAAKALRTALEQATAGEAAGSRSIVDWLRASPLVGVDWYAGRSFEAGRKVVL
jgi:hypothetical protein